MTTNIQLYNRYKDLFLSKRRSIIPFIHKKRKRKIDDFIIKREIGFGLSGVIQLATTVVDPELLVAIKILDKTKKHSKREVNILRKVQSPNIIKYYDSFSDNKQLYLILEYCPNGDLCELLLSESFLSESTVKPILLDICKGIKACHDKNIVHGDIKKENVVLFDDCAKLIDFGLSFKETYNGDIIGGTVCYMAPEIARNFWHMCGKKVDIWALGVLTYELLTGYAPFGVDGINTVNNIIQLNYHIPRYVSTDARMFIRSLLQLSPIMRPSIDDILNNKWLLT